MEGGRFGGPREMHDAVCSDCGAETKVPFKPADGRPVYCRDCYQKHKTQR
jgi:CxxC-x17-CxxC domain-containing protein